VALLPRVSHLPVFRSGKVVFRMGPPTSDPEPFAIAKSIRYFGRIRKILSGSFSLHQYPT